MGKEAATAFTFFQSFETFASGTEQGSTGNNLTERVSDSIPGNLYGCLAPEYIQRFDYNSNCNFAYNEFLLLLGSGMIIGENPKLIVT